MKILQLLTLHPLITAKQQQLGNYYNYHYHYVTIAQLKYTQRMTKHH